MMNIEFDMDGFVKTRDEHTSTNFIFGGWDFFWRELVQGRERLSTRLLMPGLPLQRLSVILKVMPLKKEILNPKCKPNKKHNA